MFPNSDVTRPLIDDNTSVDQAFSANIFLILFFTLWIGNPRARNTSLLALVSSPFEKLCKAAKKNRRGTAVLWQPSIRAKYGLSTWGSTCFFSPSRNSGNCSIVPVYVTMGPLDRKSAQKQQQCKQASWCCLCVWRMLKVALEEPSKKKRIPTACYRTVGL